jgi:hypothetical protein
MANCLTGGFNPDAFDAISLNYFNAVDDTIRVSDPNATADDSVIYKNVTTLDDGTPVLARLVLVEKSNEHLKVDLAFSDEYEIRLNGNNNAHMNEPPRVYRRVICSHFRRPYRVCSGLHRTPPLLLLAGHIRWGRAAGDCYTNRPISVFPIRPRASISTGRSG